jgi:hypothetical protein
MVSADLLNVTGTVSLSGANLELPLQNLPTDNFVNGTILLVANDASDLVTGSFEAITGLSGGYTATIDYAYAGTDMLGRIGDGNDIAVTLLPEPTTVLLLGVIAAGQLARRRRR